MPTDYELYYGFTRFAIELNELCPEMKDLLPPTDARFRRDQRYVSALLHPRQATRPIRPRRAQCSRAHRQGTALLAVHLRKAPDNEPW